VQELDGDKPTAAKQRFIVGCRQRWDADQPATRRAADRAVRSHWEGDLLIGLQRSALGTWCWLPFRIAGRGGLGMSPSRNEITDYGRACQSGRRWTA
jgi:hypothetical protein